MAADGPPTAPGASRELALLSVVAPIFDEEATIPVFYERVCSALAGLPFELVLVDDGSTDLTARLLAGLAESNPKVRVITLSRNFGHQAALTAGLDNARGNAVVMLDSDLQDPPEVIPKMVESWRLGADVVYAVREGRPGESQFKLATAGWFYRFFGRLASVNLAYNSGDFRLLDRRALDALLAMRERARFLRGMTVWVGYTQTAIPYRREPRYAGKTKFSLQRMVRFSLDAVFSFSNIPLQAATLLGFMFSGLAFLAIPVVIGLRLADSYLPGFGTITIVVLMLGGIQLIAIGVIGEYLGRVYEEVKRRPLYVVRHVSEGAESMEPEAESRELTAP